MKIGINARFLVHPYTGIGQYTRNLVQTMAKRTPENEYLLFVPELVDVALPENCRQIRVKEGDYRSDSIRKAHWEHVLVPIEMERFKIDLAHFPYPANPRKKLPFPVVVTVHDVIPWKVKAYRQRWRSKAYHFNARLALKKADHLLTVSQFSKHEIVKAFKIDEKNITVTPLAAPQAELGDSCPSVPLRRPFFVYSGGYDERKNVPRMMEAFQKYIAPYQAIDLILVGAKGKGLEALLTDRYRRTVDGRIPIDPRGKIIFTEPIAQSELSCLYQKALAMVHVSEYEGFNLSLVEAMQAQIPIVTSNLTVHREVTGGHALFVDPLSIDSIGLAMHQLVNDRSLQRQLVDEQKEKAEEYDWGKVAEETLYVYDLYSGSRVVV